MKSMLFWALIALNIVLMISFVSKFAAPSAAVAQNSPARRPGEYAMIPGQVTGGTSGVVYVVDTTNGLLTAITYDQSTGPQGRLASLQQINLTEIFARGSNTPPANNPNDKKGRR